MQTAAIKTMNLACAAVGNRDIEKFVPALITAMANPAEVPETVHKLSATTFVQAVEAPALSIMVPLLVRGLRERQTAIKRKSAVIIDNMSKLVDNPADAAVFLPRWVLLIISSVEQDVLTQPTVLCRKMLHLAKCFMRGYSSVGMLVSVCCQASSMTAAELQVQK